MLRAKESSIDFFNKGEEYNVKQTITLKGNVYIEPKKNIKPLTMAIINKSTDYSNGIHIKQNGIVVAQTKKQPISSKAKAVI